MIPKDEFLITGMPDKLLELLLRPEGGQVRPFPARA